MTCPRQQGMCRKAATLGPYISLLLIDCCCHRSSRVILSHSSWATWHLRLLIIAFIFISFAIVSLKEKFLNWWWSWFVNFCLHLHLYHHHSSMPSCCTYMDKFINWMIGWPQLNPTYLLLFTRRCPRTPSVLRKVSLSLLFHLLILYFFTLGTI